MNLLKNNHNSLSWCYFLFFAILGIFLPYFNLYCYHLKFSGGQIGLISGVTTIMKMLSPFLWASLADRWISRKQVTLVTTLGSALAFLPCLWIRSFPAMLLAIAIFSFFQMGILPLIESATWERLEFHGGEYGKIRWWGSIGFIAAAFFCGTLLDILPLETCLYLIAMLSFVFIAVILRIPENPRTHPDTPLKTSVTHFIRTPEIALFLLICVFMQISHGAYYGFFAIYLEGLGYPKSVTGISWTTAVLCEVLVMLRYQRWFGKFKPQTLLIVSSFIGSLRWWVTGHADLLIFLLLAQCAHAMTYAAFHIASMSYLNAKVPRHLRTSAIGILSALSYGLGGTLGLLFSGFLYDSAGARFLFSASSLFSALTGLLAIWHFVISAQEAPAEKHCR